MYIETDWSGVKDFVDSRSVSPQYTEDNNHYYIFVLDGQFGVKTRLEKNPTDTTDLDDWNSNYKPSSNAKTPLEPSPFGSKVLPNGKSLFRRIHGLKLDLDTSGSDQKVAFTVPYGSAKITSTEIIGAGLGDRIDFKVLDTAAGTVTTVPNYMLNQFGFDVYPSEGRYEQKSEYDADLFLGLQLEITVKPMDSVARPVYFNLVLHEVG